MAAKTTTRRKPANARSCAAAHVGCTCAGNTVEHNMQAIDRMKARQADAPRSTCPECGLDGNAAIIAALGRCFDCKRDADAKVYGFAPTAEAAPARRLSRAERIAAAGAAEAARCAASSAR